jgi:hypothetical protein
MTVLLHTIGFNEDGVYKFDIHYTTEDSKSTKIVYCIHTFRIIAVAIHRGNPVGADNMRPDWANGSSPLSFLDISTP